MAFLPSAKSIMSEFDVIIAFRDTLFRAENQAKAAYKNNFPLSKKGVQWILLVGPHWLPKTLVRILKQQ
ncbi:hypothetical protein EDB92DRAFT_1420401 [Lactarius akahatsu]|uniref:Uncharacterized protein n=1 Tax=Lactarius akahatsu TaxID=416441 RepID=A0AAD4LLC9_9AGAM|nr:hypothetical protein EDB92DRAFT_1420401 [Lactarius akahatsu]